MIKKFSNYNNINESSYVDHFDFLYKNAPEKLKEYIDNTKGIKQSSVWHPEGDVYTHIRLVTNRLHNTYHDINLDLAGLFHDLGKFASTEWNEKTQDWGSAGHEDTSVEILSDFYNWVVKMGGDYDIIEYVIDSHMRIKYLDEFRIQNKIKTLENEHLDYLLKFNTADYGGTDLDCKPVIDLSNIFKEIEDFHKHEEIKKEISKKFNGNIIMEKYPDLTGRELGNSISNFKKYISRNMGIVFDDYIYNTNETEIFKRFDLFMLENINDIKNNE